MKKSISLKIFSIAILFLLLMAVVSGLSTMSIGRVAQKSNELSEYYLPLERHVQMAARHASAEVILFNSLVDSRSGNSSKAEFDKSFGKMRARASGVDEEINSALQLVDQGLSDHGFAGIPVEFASLKQELPQIKDAHDEMRDTIQSYLKETESSKPDVHTVVVLNKLLITQRDRVSKEILDVTDILDRLSKESAESVLQQEQQVLYLNLGITLAVSVIGLVLAWMMTRSLVRPIFDLLTGTRAVRNGDLTVEVKVSSTDELATLTDAFNHMIQGLKQKEEIQRTFGHYVDPRIVENLIQDGGLTRQGERKEMTVFFSDLEGFTKLCEDIQPDLAVRFLNQYFDTMATPILSSSGIIDKYIGDSIMAYWGAPFCNEQEHAQLACEAALEQVRLMDGFRQMVPDILGLRRNVPVINMRIGISTGEVTIGNVGSSKQKGYTVIGDTVNLAARLESVNKQYGTTIIISEQVWQHAKDRVETRELDSIRVVGKAEPVRIFELLARKGELTSRQLECRDIFNEALACYRKGEIDQAQLHWSRCLELSGEDAATRLFLSRIELLRREGLPADWDGVWNLKSK